MKNCKSILLILVSIIAINSHITQTYNDSAWDRFWNTCANLLRTGSAYENHLNQLSNQLGNFPQEDRNFIISETRKRLISEDPQDDERAIRRITSKVIVKRAKHIVPSIARSCKGTWKEKENATYYIVGEVQAFLDRFIDRNESLDNPRLTQVFERVRLKELIEQEILYINNQLAYTKTAYSPQPVYPPKQPTYPPRPVQKVPTPIKPSETETFKFLNEDFLTQFGHDLKGKGVPLSEIPKIKSDGREELNRKKPTNDHTKINIMNEALINRVRMNARTIAKRRTSNELLIGNASRAMSENIRAALAQEEDNSAEPKLAKFFDSRFERMVKQNISAAQSAKKVDPPKPAPFAPSAPPAPFAPSAPEELKQKEKNDCCVTGNNCTEEFGVGNIPCKGGAKHSEKICSSCASQLTICPICRETLIK